MTTYLVDGVDVAALPKVSLHDHLDGSLRPGTILELAEAAGIEVPATTSEELAAWFLRQSNSGSLVEYLTTFDLTCAVMQTAQALERIARESVLDLAADGVIYGELRWAPEQHLTKGLSLDETVEAVQRGLEQGMEDALAQGVDIRVGQLITAMRHADRGREIAELALRHRDNGVVGFDIAGAEIGFPPSKHRAAFDLLAENFFPVTVHAGEAEGLSSIESALVDGRALRLGHGVRLAEDIEVVREEGDTVSVTLGHVANWVRDRQIALEIAPSSNLQTGAVAAWGETLDAHPFDLLYQLGFCVTVNADNRLQSGTSLTQELGELAQTFDYGLADIEAFQLNAAASAFMSVDECEELSEAVHDGFIAAVGDSRAK